MTSKLSPSGPPPLASATSSPLLLASKTSLGLGGAARTWVAVQDIEALRGRVVQAHRCGEPLLVLGGGSNLVCADEGFDGGVLEVCLRGAHADCHPPISGSAGQDLLSLSQRNARLNGPEPEFSGSQSDVWLHIAAGESWDDVVAATCRWGWAGVECLSGIPGKAGATPIQNVGAYGQELSDSLCQVTCIDQRSGRLVTFTREACHLGYRDSRFKNEDRGAFVIVELVLHLKRRGQPTLRYPELARKLTQTAPSLPEVRRVVLDTRRAKSMLLDPNDANGRNCGSFFVNPIVARQAWQALQTRWQAPVPCYEVDAKRVKIPAAWLIEHAGFPRGHRAGNVGLSTKHTLCLVAHDGATAHEYVAFARQVRDGVRDQFGIELVPEPVLVGLVW